MRISELRERVRSAREQAASDASLRNWLQQKLPQLHRAINVRDVAENTLFDFIENYIERVPDMLEAAQSVARHARMQNHLLPVLRVAEAFFLQPPAVAEAQHGLLLLLDEAYLAHRLVEEVNDRYLSHGGESLIPMDNIKANLVVHQLLGEDYANQLDAAVAEAVAGLLPEEVFSSAEFIAYQQGIDEQLRRDMWHRWPSISDELGVELSWRDR